MLNCTFEVGHGSQDKWPLAKKRGADWAIIRRRREDEQTFGSFFCMLIQA